MTAIPTRTDLDPAASLSASFIFLCIAVEAGVSLGEYFFGSFARFRPRPGKITARLQAYQPNTRPGTVPFSNVLPPQERPNKRRTRRIISDQGVSFRRVNQVDLIQPGLDAIQELAARIHPQAACPPDSSFLRRAITSSASNSHASAPRSLACIGEQQQSRPRGSPADSRP